LKNEDEKYELPRVLDCSEFGDEFIVDCAWSFHTSFMKEGYYRNLKDRTNKPKKIVCIEELCEILNIEVEADFEELGLGFNEYVVIDNNGKVFVDEEYDLIETNIKCPECFDENESYLQFWEDEPETLFCTCCDYERFN